MIPLALVTGFLGAGKTTFLQEQAKALHGRPIAWLVNEFSPLDVDGTRLSLARGEVVTIAGGSIFCKCKVTDFIRVLRGICALSAAPEGVIVEASGIADPRVTTRMLEETGLDREFTLSMIASVIDPGTFHKLRHTLPNILAQVECADVILINKADMHSTETLSKTREEILSLHPGVRIEETSYCRANIDLFAPAPARTPNGDYAKCIDPHFTQQTLRIDMPQDIERLREAVEGMRDTIYRAKGVLPIPGGFCEIDFAAGQWEQRPASETANAPATGVVLIARGEKKEELSALVHEIQTGGFAA